MRLTNHDVLTCVETYLEICLEEDPDGPETMCLSFGYAEVCHDGDVVAWGRVLINVAVIDTVGIPDDDEPYAANTPEGEE
jgi:hypothetical protein